MKKSIIITMAMLLIVIISALAASAQSDDKSQRITLELKDTPVRSALDTLFRGRGLNYVVDQSVGGNVSSLSLRDVPFDVALKMLLKSVDPPLVYRKEGDVYLISVKKEQVETPGAQIVTPTVDLTAADTDADDIKMEKIPLNFIDAYDLKATIEAQNTTRQNGWGGNSGWGNSGGMGGSSGWGNNSGSSGWGNNSGWGSGSSSWGSGSSGWGSSSSGSGRFSGRSSY